jgi:cytidylate kinase
MSSGWQRRPVGWRSGPGARKEKRMTTPIRSLEVRAENLEHTQHHWQQRHREQSAAPGAALSVALMREAGTPGTTVAQEVGARLGWQVYDYELLQRIAAESGLRLKVLESVDERHKNWLTEAVEAFSAVPAVGENTYFHRLIQTVLSLAALGRCVIVGRGSAFILPGERTLRVRLVGQLDDRIEGTARRQGLSRDEAARWVEETERERSSFVREHFHKDQADPHYYDLVLNSSRWSVPECASLIVDAVRRLESRLGGA